MRADESLRRGTFGEALSTAEDHRSSGVTDKVLINVIADVLCAESSGDSGSVASSDCLRIGTGGASLGTFSRFTLLKVQFELLFEEIIDEYSRESSDMALSGELSSRIVGPSG